MKETKIFVLGFQKTGTTSLEHALTHLGYNVYGGDKNLLKIEDKEELKQYIRHIASKYDAFQDMPWPLFYKELYELFPEAKYILTYRDPDTWIDSVVRYFAKIRIPMHQQIYGVPCAEGYEEVYMEVYKKYNDDIQNFFKGKTNFLKMEIGKNFDYNTLGQFLGLLDMPDEEFPKSRSNKQQLSKYKWYRQLRSIYWNYTKGY